MGDVATEPDRGQTNVAQGTVTSDGDAEQAADSRLGEPSSAAEQDKVCTALCPSPAPTSDIVLDEDGDSPLASPETETGETISLTRASWLGRLRIVRRLLQQRADPNVFEAHTSGSTRLTPLMAACAGGRVPVVAELLVAGADPDLPSTSGVVAGDLADNNAVGHKIGKLLATFRVEIETHLSSSLLSSPVPPSSPDVNSSSGAGGGASAVPVSAILARQQAIAKVKERGVALVEKALLGYSSSLACDESEIALAGEWALKGDDARKARKQRLEDKEATRLQRVAERAAARRGVDHEGDRLRRVAEKAASRRALALNPEQAEEERLRRVAEKAAARREKQAEEDASKREKEEAKLRRLADKATDRASARELRAAVVAEIEHKDRVETAGQPVKRKIVEAEAVLCPSCGTSTTRQRCGRCGQMGMCSTCSKCCMCGTVSGFATKVARGIVPGQYPDLCDR